MQAHTTHSPLLHGPSKISVPYQGENIKDKGKGDARVASIRREKKKDTAVWVEIIIVYDR